jgi:hypothetical protein
MRKALQSGDMKIVTDLLSEKLKSQNEKWFSKALHAKKHKDKSLKAGRE